MKRSSLGLIGFVVIVVMMMLASCKTARLVSSAATVTLHERDSIHTEYVETVRIDTVTVEVKVPMERVVILATDTASHLETAFAFSNAWINPDGTLGHLLENKQGALPVDVLVPNRTVREASAEQTVREVPVPVPVEVERDFTGWEKFRLKGFYWLSGLLLASIAWIFRRPLIKVFS